MVHDGASKRGGDFVTSVARLTCWDVARRWLASCLLTVVAGGAGSSVHASVVEARAEERGCAGVAGLARLSCCDVGCGLPLCGRAVVALRAVVGDAGMAESDAGEARGVFVARFARRGCDDVICRLSLRHGAVVATSARPDRLGVIVTH